jgi:hypothetical protein
MGECGSECGSHTWPATPGRQGLARRVTPLRGRRPRGFRIGRDRPDRSTGFRIGRAGSAGRVQDRPGRVRWAGRSLEGRDRRLPAGRPEHTGRPLDESLREGERGVGGRGACGLGGWAAIPCPAWPCRPLTRETSARTMIRQAAGRDRRQEQRTSGRTGRPVPACRPAAGRLSLGLSAGKPAAGLLSLGT